MLETYLENAIKELDVLITLTQEDIAFIKEADHEMLASRESLKKHALRCFETTKTQLNQELLERTKSGEDELEEALTDAQNILLDAFKEKLIELKEVNVRYSKLLIPVNEFFGTLFNDLFKFDSAGYQKTVPLPAAMLRVSA